MKFGAVVMLLWLIFGVTGSIVYFTASQIIGSILVIIGALCLIIGFAILLLAVIFDFDLPD